VYGRISRLRFAIIRRSDQNVANRYESTVPLIYDRRSLAPRNQSGSDSVTSGLKILTFLLYAERFTGALEYLERGVGLKDEYRALQKTSRKRGRTREYAPRYVASDAIHAFEGDLDSGVVSPPGIERGSAGGTALEASTSKIAATVSDVCTRRCNTRRVHGIPSCSSASDKSHRGEGEGEGGGGYCRYPALLAASAVLLTVDGNTITLLFERVRRVLHYSLARRVSLSLSLSLSHARARASTLCRGLSKLPPIRQRIRTLGNPARRLVDGSLSLEERASRVEMRSEECLDSRGNCRRSDIERSCHRSRCLDRREYLCPSMAKEKPICEIISVPIVSSTSRSCRRQTA